MIYPIYLLPAIALNTFLLTFPITTNFLNSLLLVYLKFAFMDLVLDSIIGSNSSFPYNSSIYSYICLITLLCPPTEAGGYFPTSCDLLWQWNMSRCCRSKGLTYSFRGLAWLLCSGSAIRRLYPGFLVYFLPWSQSEHPRRPELHP